MRYEDIKPGQRVRVVRKLPDWHIDDEGRKWHATWDPGMDRFVGGVHTVVGRSGAGGVYLSGDSDGFSFPWAALELISQTSTSFARVIHPGQAYTTHSDWPKEFGLTNYARGKLPPTEVEFKVIHHDVDRKVYALEAPNGDQYLVGSYGVKLFKKSEENTVMSTTATVPLFQTKTFINGRDAASFTAEELIETIRQAEGKIAELKAIKAKSEHIASRILNLQGQLAEVVRVLDGRQEGH